MNNWVKASAAVFSYVRLTRFGSVSLLTAREKKILRTTESGSDVRMEAMLVSIHWRAGLTADAEGKHDHSSCEEHPAHNCLPDTPKTKHTNLLQSRNQTSLEASGYFNAVFPWASIKVYVNTAVSSLLLAACVMSKSAWRMRTLNPEIYYIISRCWIMEHIMQLCF